MDDPASRMALTILGPILIIAAVAAIAFVVAVVRDPGGRDGENWAPGQVTQAVAEPAWLTGQTGAHRVIGTLLPEEIAPDVNHCPRHALDRLPEYLLDQLAEMNPVKRARELVELIETFGTKGVLA